jgi:hypothetical protein
MDIACALVWEQKLLAVPHATNDHLRRVSYAGVREDIDAQEVVKET